MNWSQESNVPHETKIGEVQLLKVWASCWVYEVEIQYVPCASNKVEGVLSWKTMYILICGIGSTEIYLWNRL